MTVNHKRNARSEKSSFCRSCRRKHAPEPGCPGVPALLVANMSVEVTRQVRIAAAKHGITTSALLAQAAEEYFAKLPLRDRLAHIAAEVISLAMPDASDDKDEFGDGSVISLSKAAEVLGCTLHEAREVARGGMEIAKALDWADSTRVGDTWSCRALAKGYREQKARADELQAQLDAVPMEPRP